MKAVSSNFKEELKTYGREFDDIITYNNNTLNQEDLISVILSYDCSLLKTQMKCLKINCNTSIDIGTTINYQLGLKVNGNYEYIDYGNYIVKEVEEEKNTNSYLITCYDKMLLTMVDYQSIREYTATTDSTFQDNKKYYIYTIEDEYILYTGPTTGNPSSLNLYEDTTYRVTIRDYISRICNYLGITFKNANEKFANCFEYVNDELYATYNTTSNTWENRGYTFRDVLDDIAEATGSFIIINENDELEIKYTSTKNLLDVSRWRNQYWTGTQSIQDNRYAMFLSPIYIIKNVRYTISANQNVTKIQIDEYKQDGDYGLYLDTKSTSIPLDNYVYTPTGEVDYIIVTINYDNSTTMTQQIIDSLELQVEKGRYRTLYQSYTTLETIDEEYFNDNNVNVGKLYGPINVVTLSRENVDNIYYPITQPQNSTELKISNNQILQQEDRQYFIQDIYDRVVGTEYFVCELNTKGLLYFELGDYYNVSLRGTTYKCLMLNDEITKTSGLKEYIYIDEPEANVSDYQYIDPTRKAYFLADKANGLAEMIVEGIGSNGEVTGASVIASINDDTSQLKLNADKIYINGVTFDQNQTMTMTEGSILIEQRPDEQNSIYTYRNYPDDHEIHEASLVPEGMLTDIRDTNTDNMIMLGEYYASNFRVQDNSNNMIYGDATNLSMINSNHDTTFEVDGPTGNANVLGSVVLGSVKTKNILHNLTYDAIGQWGMSYALTNDRILVVNSEGKAWAWVRYFLYNVPTGTSLTFSCNFTASGNANTSVTIYDNDGNELTRSTNTTATSGSIKLTFTTTTSAIKISFSANSSGSQITNTATFTNLMVERGSSATTYYPYQELNEVMPKNKNLFNYDVYDNQCSTMTKTSSINGFTITASQYANSSGIKLKDFCPQMEVGKTYFLSGISTSPNAKYIYVGEVWNYGSSKTITQSMLDTVVGFYGRYPQGSGSGTITISNIQIEEGELGTSFTTYKGIGYVYGKNGNGKYIKYDDGTLIQWNRIEVNNQAINSAYGSLYQGTRYLTFPIPFVGDIPSCQCTEFQWGTGASWGTIATVSLTNLTCRGIDITSRATGTNCRIGWFAIGRWK